MCSKRCFDGYYKTEEGECVPKWTVIGFQDTFINNTNYTQLSLTFGEKTEPLDNFFDFNGLEDTNNEAYDIFKDSTDADNIFWRLKLEWELENQVLGEIIWEQERFIYIYVKLVYKFSLNTTPLMFK
jgi:hypothetical protein